VETTHHALDFRYNTSAGSILKLPGKMPDLKFEPSMLATLVRTLPEGPEWEYELKLDGYRLQAIKIGEEVRLYSRRGRDFTKKFGKIAKAVAKIQEASFILDGEAVAVDEKGKPSFQMLQNRASLPPGWNLVYYAFDLLHLNGQDLKDRPLKERRALLEKVLGDSGVLLSQSLPGTLSQIMQAVKQHGLEGVIAKRLDSKYQSGQRSKVWLKLPLKTNQDFVIGAYRLDGARLEILLVGYFERGKLMFAGKVHQGLNPATDHGMVLLIDARFNEVRYRRLFPTWWKYVRVRHSDSLRQAVGHFWQQFST